MTNAPHFVRHCSDPKIIRSFIKRHNLTEVSTDIYIAPSMIYAHFYMGHRTLICSPKFEDFIRKVFDDYQELKTSPLYLALNS